MKTAFLLFGILLLFATLKAQSALPPTTLKAQNGSKSTTFNFEVPNQQSTKTTTGGLIETGNSNILKDPSLEGANNSSAWVFSGGVLTIDNTPIHGLINGQIDTTATSLSMTQSSTLYQAQFADGVQGLASMRVRVPSSITTPIYVCSIQNGVEGSTSSGCVQVQANGKWGLYKVPFILGATSNGIALTSKGVSYTGTIEWDDGFVGAVDLQASVDQSRIAGESYFAGTTSCTWSRTSTTIGAFTSTAACPGPTIVDGSMGSWQTTDSDLPRQTINNLPAGKYKATFTISSNPSVAATNALAINDGTTTCYASEGNNNASAVNGNTVSCVFNYSSSGNRVFEVYGASSSGTVTISGNRTSPAIGNKFQLEYFGSGSVYSSNCGANCVDTFSAKISSADATSEENTDFINGNCTNATTGRGTCTYNSGVFTVTPNCSITAVTDSAEAFIVSQSSSAITYETRSSSGTAANSGVNIICQKQGADFTATRTIIGSFNEVMTTPGVTKPVMCSAKISSAGVISDQRGGCFASCTNATTPVCTFTTGFWTSGQVPNCWHSTSSNLIAGRTTSTTTFQGLVLNSVFAIVAGDREYYCHGSIP